MGKYLQLNLYFSFFYAMLPIERLTSTKKKKKFKIVSQFPLLFFAIMADFLC